MKLKTIVITGASDGIGKAAAKILKEKGYDIVIVGRSKLKTKQVAQELGVKYYTADFSVLSDVRKLASDLNNDLKRIDVLVNNAGAVMGKRELTVDGNEKTLQVNHLSAFLLTNLLISKLVSCKATVINTSSVANRLLSNFDIEDLNLNKGYSPTRAYGNAKLANIFFTKELNKRYGGKGIRTAAFHPGNVASNFSTDSNSLFMKIVYKSPLKRFLVSPIRGAETLVWLIESDLRANKVWESGEFYEKKRIGKTKDIVNDPLLAKRLWQQSIDMTKIEDTKA